MTKTTRQWLILIVAVAVITAAYAAAGFLGVPRLLRSQLLSFISQHYHRTASIGAIRFNPFTFALEAHDFTFPDADGQPMVAFGRLRVDLEAATLWRVAPSFSDIELDRPFVRTLVRKDGAVNLADLAKPFETRQPQPPSTKPARVFVERLSVNAGQAIYQDQSRPSPFQARLEPITFELRDFSTTGKTDNAYSLMASSTNGERFAWQGSFSVTPLASRGRFQVADLQAHTIWSYLRDTLGFELSNGRINFDGDYELTTNPALGLNVNVHTVALSDLGLRPNGGQTDYVQRVNARIENARVDLVRQRIDIGRVQLTSGTVHAWRDAKGEINLMQLVSSGKPTKADAGPNGNTADDASPPSSRPSAKPMAARAASASAPPGARSAATTAPKNAPSSWVIAAPDIALEDLRVELEDRLVKPAATFTLVPVNVNVRGYSTAPDTVLDLDASLHINDSAEVTARGKFSPQTGAASAHLDLSGFDLESVQPYINTYTQITLLSGVLKTGLDIERTAKGAFDIKGNTEVTKLRTVDNALRQDFIKWDKLSIEGMHYQSDPASLRIRTLAARAPYGRVIIAPDQSLNITEALSPTPGPAPPAVQTVRTPEGNRHAPGGNPAAMQVSIGTVKLTDGSANFADFWIQPNYAVSLQGLSGTVTGLSSDPKSRAKVQLAGKVDRYAPAKIDGEINLLSAALFTDMKVSFQGVEMTSVTPYSGRFAGYKIEKGKLSINVEYHVDNRKLDARQRFVVDQLQLGERVESPDAVHLPLRLAVALLKDRNGVIDLDLPISGSLDDPKFRLAPLIWKAFVNVITKAATAPFKLLGSLFGGGENMNLVDFPAGEATLDDAARDRIASVAKALKERPQLQLDVPASWSADLDRDALATRKLNEKLQTLAEQKGTETKGKSRKGNQGASGDVQAQMSDPARRFDLLLTQYHADYGADAAPTGSAAAVLSTPKKKVEPSELDAANDELTRAITAKQEVTDSDLEMLAQARAHAIQDALLSQGGIDPSRVFMLGATATKPQDGKVRVALALK